MEHDGIGSGRLEREQRGGLPGAAAHRVAGGGHGHARLQHALQRHLPGVHGRGAGLRAALQSDHQKVRLIRSRVSFPCRFLRQSAIDSVSLPHRTGSC